jgi:tetratricopeptide (TPR) repeat protein
MRDRMLVAPFTGQIDHARQVQDLDSQLARYRMANKPAQVRRDIAAVSQVVARHPEDPDLRWNLAVLLENGGDAAGAEEQWRAAIRLQPQAALPRINLAKLLERVGRQPEALTLYAEGLHINPEYFPARLALGLLCLANDRIAEAIHHLGLAARQRPEAVDVRLALGQALVRANRRSAAEREFREVLRIDPGNVQAQEQLRAISSPR